MFVAVYMVFADFLRGHRHPRPGNPPHGPTTSKPVVPWMVPPPLYGVSGRVKAATGGRMPRSTSGQFEHPRFDVVVLGAGGQPEVFAVNRPRPGSGSPRSNSIWLPAGVLHYACMPSRRCSTPVRSWTRPGAPGVRGGGHRRSGRLRRSGTPRRRVIHHLDDSSQLARLRGARDPELFRGSGVIAGERGSGNRRRCPGGRPGGRHRHPAPRRPRRFPVCPRPRSGTTGRARRPAPQILIHPSGAVRFNCAGSPGPVSLGSEVTIFEPEEQVLVHENPPASDLVEQLSGTVTGDHGHRNGS